MSQNVILFDFPQKFENEKKKKKKAQLMHCIEAGSAPDLAWSYSPMMSVLSVLGVRLSCQQELQQARVRSIAFCAICRGDVLRGVL